MGRTKIKKNTTGKGKGKSLAALKKRKQLYGGGIPAPTSAPIQVGAPVDFDIGNSRGRSRRKAVDPSPDIIQGGSPGDFGYLSPEEKSRREKGYQDRMARQKKAMDEAVANERKNRKPQRAVRLGGPNDPSSENYIDPRIKIFEEKRKRQEEYDASAEGKQRKAQLAKDTLASQDELQNWGNNRPVMEQMDYPMEQMAQPQSPIYEEKRELEKSQPPKSFRPDDSGVGSQIKVAPRAKVGRVDTGGPIFDADSYMAANLDLQQYARANPDFDPYEHYLTFGASEGRSGGSFTTVTGDKDIQKIAAPDDVTADTVTADSGTTVTGPAAQGEKAAAITGDTYDSTDAKDLDPTKAAKGVVTRDGVAEQATLTERAKAGTLLDKEIKAAQAQKAAQRPDNKDYASAARDDGDPITVETVTGPTVDTRTGVVIPEETIAKLTKLAKERGLDPKEALQAFKDAAATRTAQTGTAATGTAETTGIAPIGVAAEAGDKTADYIADAIKQTIAGTVMGAPSNRTGNKIIDQKLMTSASAGGESAVEQIDRIAYTDAISATSTPAQTAKLNAFTLGLSRTAQTGVAVERKYVDTMGMPPEDEAAQAEYFEADFTPEGGGTNLDAIPAYGLAATRIAQVTDAATKIAAELGDAPSVDLEGREAITGSAPVGNAAQIGGVPTMAAGSMQAVQGKDRIVASADMLKVVANVPEDITAAIAQDPATVEAQLDSGTDPKTVAAIAALPVEALVSTQMESLLAGMEDGETPAWARPAVSQIEQMMASRGLSASTVGRDALFNAIIQSALPMAQSNAQALQQRAQQNLSNEQQANMSTAQNTMQIRMQNLANRQTAASQTADMAQQIKVQQGSFDQQAVMTSSQQKQETSMANAQMAQQQAQQTSAQTQQAAIAQLSTNAQMDLANLQALNAAAGQNLSADQQARLQTYNAQVSKTMRQADLNQDMEKANLSPALQVEMQRVSEMNAASKDTMTAEQTERLTQLQTLIDFRKTDAQFAQQMDMANMSNEQQVQLAMLQDKAATDTANFTAANQFELTRLNNVVARSARQGELDQQMEVANLDSSLKIELSQLSEMNTTERANMSADQQMRLKNLETLVTFKTANSQLAQQMDMASMGNAQQMQMAILTDKAATDSANFTETNRFKLTQLQTAAQHMSQNTEFRQQTELANMSTEERLQLANLTAKNQASSENLSADQQVELANLNAKLTIGVKNAELRQQAISQTFTRDQQTELANLESLNKADSESLSNEQQDKLTTYNAAVQKSIRKTELDSRMEEVNLDARLKVELSELSEKNTTERANMSSEQQMRLANLNVLVDFKKADAGFAQQMELANLGNKQQIELAELQDKSSTDAANFTEANRARTQELNTFVQVMSQNEGLKQNADMAQLSMQEKINLANLSSQSQADISSMSAVNMAQLQVYEKKMAAGQVNAQLAQQMGLANLSNEQSATMFNAQIDANMDMKQFDANQQIALSNSQFMKTVSLKNLDNRQQEAMQNATALASMDISNADSRTRVSVENAKNFLAMDMGNLSNRQQGVVLDQQLKQQQYLSEAAASNASKQFNATSQNQTDQFMIGVGQQMEQFNAAQANAMTQSNTSEKNRMTALREGNTLDADKFSAQIALQAKTYNADMDFKAEQWNAANAQAVEQSNITWRRGANTAATAAQNAANQQSASFEFNMNASSQANMWQELRQTAQNDFASNETKRDRLINVINSALQNEALMTNSQLTSQRAKIFKLLNDITEDNDAPTDDMQDIADDAARDIGPIKY